MSISNHSPHLASVLGRLVPKVDFGLLSETFDFCILLGGNLELGFEGDLQTTDRTHCNPRVARVALILINDAQVIDTVAIGATLLASVWSENVEARIYSQGFGQQVLTLAQRAKEPPKELLAQSSKHDYIAGVIAVVLHLDRVRHVHLIGRQHNTEDVALAVRPEFLNQTEQYIALARYCSQPLYKLLSKWWGRYFERTQIVAAGTRNE